MLSMSFYLLGKCRQNLYRWAKPKELHHFAKYFMGVLQQTDAEVDNSYRLLSTPYASSGEQIYQIGVQSEQEVAEDDELLRGCPLMTTHETEIADRYIPPEERLVYHDGDLMTQKEFKEAEQRVLDLFAPVEYVMTQLLIESRLPFRFPHTNCHGRHAPYQGRKSNHAREEPVQVYNNGAASSQSSRPSTKTEFLPERTSRENKNTILAPAKPPAISESIKKESSSAKSILVPDQQGDRAQEAADGWVLVQEKRRGSVHSMRKTVKTTRFRSNVEQNSPRTDSSSVESFDLLVSSENEDVLKVAPQAVAEKEKEPAEQEEEPAPRYITSFHT